MTLWEGFGLALSSPALAKGDRPRGVALGVRIRSGLSPAMCMGDVRTGGCGRAPAVAACRLPSPGPSRQGGEDRMGLVRAHLLRHPERSRRISGAIASPASAGSLARRAPLARDPRLRRRSAFDSGLRPLLRMTGLGLACASRPAGGDAPLSPAHLGAEAALLPSQRQRGVGLRHLPGRVQPRQQRRADGQTHRLQQHGRRHLERERPPERADVDHEHEHGRERQP